jgi:hypothetical protein
MEYITTMATTTEKLTDGVNWITAFMMWLDNVTLDKVKQVYETDDDHYALTKLEQLQRSPAYWYGSLDSANRLRLANILKAKMALFLT